MQRTHIRDDLGGVRPGWGVPNGGYHTSGSIHFFFNFNGLTNKSHVSRENAYLIDTVDVKEMTEICESYVERYHFHFLGFDVFRQKDGNQNRYFVSIFFQKVRQSYHTVEPTVENSHPWNH